MYHCPDKSTGSSKGTGGENTGGRACRPSLSNLWTCPDTTPATRTEEAPTRKRVAPKQNESPGQANEYSSEAQAKSQCSNDTVVWANTRSHVYHFGGTRYYGDTALHKTPRRRSAGQFQVLRGSLDVTLKYQSSRLAAARPASSSSRRRGLATGSGGVRGSRLLIAIRLQCAASTGPIGREADHFWPADFSKTGAFSPPWGDGTGK
jgi:hypothetical protein